MKTYQHEIKVSPILAFSDSILLEIANTSIHLNYLKKTHLKQGYKKSNTK